MSKSGMKNALVAVQVDRDLLKSWKEEAKKKLTRFEERARLSNLKVEQFEHENLKLRDELTKAEEVINKFQTQVDNLKKDMSTAKGDTSDADVLLEFSIKGQISTENTDEEDVEEKDLQVESDITDNLAEESDEENIEPINKGDERDDSVMKMIQEHNLEITKLNEQCSILVEEAAKVTHLQKRWKAKHDGVLAEKRELILIYDQLSTDYNTSQGKLDHAERDRIENQQKIRKLEGLSRKDKEIITRLEKDVAATSAESIRQGERLTQVRADLLFAGQELRDVKEENEKRHFENEALSDWIKVVEEDNAELKEQLCLVQSTASQVYETRIELQELQAEMQRREEQFEMLRNETLEHTPLTQRVSNTTNDCESCAMDLDDDRPCSLDVEDTPMRDLAQELAGFEPMNMDDENQDLEAMSFSPIMSTSQEPDVMCFSPTFSPIMLNSQEPIYDPFTSIRAQDFSSGMHLLPTQEHLGFSNTMTAINDTTVQSTLHGLGFSSDLTGFSQAPFAGELQGADPMEIVTPELQTSGFTDNHTTATQHTVDDVQEYFDPMEIVTPELQTHVFNGSYTTNPLSPVPGSTDGDILMDILDPEQQELGFSGTHTTISEEPIPGKPEVVFVKEIMLPEPQTISISGIRTTISQEDILENPEGITDNVSETIRSSASVNPDIDEATVPHICADPLSEIQYVTEYVQVDVPKLIERVPFDVFIPGPEITHYQALDPIRGWFQVYADLIPIFFFWLNKGHSTFLQRIAHFAWPLPPAPRNGHTVGYQVEKDERDGTRYAQYPKKKKHCDLPFWFNIIALLVHILFYLSLYYIYACFAERSTWLKANGSTAELFRSLKATKLNYLADSIDTNGLLAPTIYWVSSRMGIDRSFPG